MIYYLAHPYTNNPEFSFNFAENTTHYLLKQGYKVFSPILHSHPFHVDMIKKHHNVGQEYIEVDYVEWDLALLEGWCEDINETLEYCLSCHGTMNPYVGCEFCDSPPQYQPKVTMLLSKTAYNRMLVSHPKRNEGFFDEEWKLEFISEGCKQEYEFANAHHIRVLELEAFLDGKEVDL